MLNRQFALLCLVGWLIFVSGGATCMRWPEPAAPQGPRVFLAPPSLQEIIAAVNNNSRRIQGLQTESATLEVPGQPRLRASIAIQTPHRFRLKAKVLGPELDLGSNDEMFWFWAKRDPNRAVYFGRYANYTFANRPQILPVEPRWLIEAFGIVFLGEGDFHEGPFPAGADQVEVRSRLNTNSGPLTRSLVVDAAYGRIMRQTLVDQRGQVLATVTCSEHRYDEVSGATLPRRMGIDLPPAQLSFRIDVLEYSINPFYEEDHWATPDEIPGYQWIDLARPGSPPAWFPSPPNSPPDQSSLQGMRPAFRPVYRGVDTGFR